MPSGPPESLALLRRDLTSQSGTISSLVDLVSDLKGKEVRRSVDDHYLDERLDRIEASIKGIHRLGWWILTAFGAAAVALVANFMFRGGFFVP